MRRRTVTVRLATGDSAALSATISLAHGAQSGKLYLHSGHPSDAWSYEVPDGERLAGRVPGWAGVTFTVEYEWGYARDATYRGEAGMDGSEDFALVLPLPGEPTDGSFPFPRRG